eukprot:6178568-Pleurochrysis_carterae.AAC.2
MMPADGQGHMTEFVQLHGSRSGYKVKWQFKLLTATAVDTHFVHGTHRLMYPTNCPMRQGSALIRADSRIAISLIPPIVFNIDGTNPLNACLAKMTVFADSIALPTDGVFRFDDSIEYDEQSKLAMRIYLAT